ncbi:cellulose synthase, partial [Nonomuraea antimicrobica]|uniref:cellulose synthase n=1 Tax=Nonomuraea antimicrobica TaxID=561173 RepID=UPI0031E9704C
MDTFNTIAWLPLCAGVSIAGLVLAFLAFRRRGAAAGMRVTAWALLPLAAFLTGALQALWTVGTTVAGFVTGLVFNPGVWAGVALAGLSVVLFVVSGVIRGRKLSAGRKNDADPPSERSARPAAGQSPQAPA